MYTINFHIYHVIYVYCSCKGHAKNQNGETLCLGRICHVRVSLYLYGKSEKPEVGDI